MQLAIPADGEALAREFFVDLLGFAEVAKPPSMAARGGAWFEAGTTIVHVGVDPEFAPAGKAHPALLVVDLRGLIESTRLAATWNDEIPGSVRCHVSDPFGNRIELIEAGS